MKKNVILRKFILMKKLSTAIIMALVLLTACGSPDDGGKQDAKDNVTNSESTTKTEFVKELTYKHFLKEVWDFERFTDSFAYNGELPCVIDFYATWCGPCKKVAPIMEKLAKEYNGKVVVYKVNIEEELKLATVLNIRNIPTVYFIEEGKQPSFSVGAKDEIYFRSRFDSMSK